MWALSWSGNGTRRASAETIMTWHDLFQLWLRALSQLETQGGLINVSQSMPLLASSEKEACSDASSLSDYFKFEFAGQVGIVYTLSSVGNSVERNAAPKSVRCFSHLDQHFYHISTLNLPLNFLSKAFHQHWEIPRGLGEWKGPTPSFQW